MAMTFSSLSRTSLARTPHREASGDVVGLVYGDRLAGDGLDRQWCCVGGGKVTEKKMASYGILPPRVVKDRGPCRRWAWCRAYSQRENGGLPRVMGNHRTEAPR